MTASLIDGVTDDGIRVRVTGTHPYDATVEIGDTVVEPRRVTLFRDGGTYVIDTSHGKILDQRKRHPADPTRTPTLDGKPIREEPDG